jgi:hypothetical protein
MAKLPNVNAGNVITSAHINAIKESVHTWLDDVNANNRSLAHLLSLVFEDGGDTINQAYINAIKSSIVTWAANVNANGKDLTNLNFLEFSGSDVWDDLRCPVQSLAPGATPADVIVFGPSGNLRVRGFNGSNTLESMEGLFQFTHGYKEGTTIYPHIHWSPTTAAAGNVKWFFEYVWQNVNDLHPGSNTTINVVGAAGGTAWKHQILSLPTLVGTGKKISSILQFRIYRDPSDVQDTYPDDAALLEVDIHYQIDTIGSRDEFIK